uniref:Transcription termination factor 3, mitochondrial n=1 Tax=Glossina palpalis gambiensis TaxID=67801 RepID=A0A1B0B7Y4_9MUSC
MLFIKYSRILIRKSSQVHSKFNNYVTTKNLLRRLSSRKIEFKYLPEPLYGPKWDEIDMAKKELAELTGGMNMDQLQQTLEPHSHKTNSKQLTLPCQSNEKYLQKAPEEDNSGSLLPTYNLAAYVNKSDTLQQFLKLGVDLSHIERKKGLPEFVLRLSFEDDVKPYLLFLKDQNVPAERLGEFITKNPLIFKVNLDDLQTRVNYLDAKRFSKAQIERILTSNPYWLMFSTRRIDCRLGYFQKEFRLAGADVRVLASKLPKLITYNMGHIQKATFSIREEMGFDKDEIKCLLLAKPRLWILKPDDLVERFAYVHQEMNLSHQFILKVPQVLTSREFRLRERHEFLKKLGRAQYDPKKDLYISPKSLIEGSNYYFVRNIAKSDMETFELFLKTR